LSVSQLLLVVVASLSGRDLHLKEECVWNSCPG